MILDTSNILQLGILIITLATLLYDKFKTQKMDKEEHRQKLVELNLRIHDIGSDVSKINKEISELKRDDDKHENRIDTTMNEIRNTITNIYNEIKDLNNSMNKRFEEHIDTYHKGM
jgi:predicted  nucleic acid-binding Zn-ribbon protein